MLPVEGTRSINPVASTDNPPQDAAQMHGRVSTKDTAQKFAGRENPDPDLARELESGIQKALDASVDRGRFDVESVLCRGNICQIVSVDRTPAPQVGGRPPDLRQGWGPNLERLFLQLDDAGMQNPHTGVRIDRPEMMQLEIWREGGGVVTYLRFR